MQLVNAQNPFVCSVVWLTDFDNFEWDAHGDSKMNSPEIEDQTHPATFKGFVNELRQLAEEYDRKSMRRFSVTSGHNQCLHRLACVLASTSHLQESAEEKLTELGFQRQGPFKKKKHSGSDLSIWIMPALDFMEAIGYPGILKILEEEKETT